MAAGTSTKPPMSAGIRAAPALRDTTTLNLAIVVDANAVARSSLVVEKVEGDMQGRFVADHMTNRSSGTLW